MKSDTNTPPHICMHVQSISRIDPRVMREATALVEAGYTVSVVDIEGDGKRPATEAIQGVQLRHVLMPGWYHSTRFPLSLLKAVSMFLQTTLRLIGTRADIYHAHDISALPASSIAALLRRKPLVFDAHELPLQDVPLSAMSRSRRFIHPFLAVSFYRMLPRCRAVIATSGAMAREITARYHYPDVEVVHNFPPYQHVTKSNRLRQHLGLDQNIRIALYQGNIQPDRELHRLVEAARYLPSDIMLVFMGKADPATLSQLEALIAREKMADRVKILPQVPYDELLEWTASADVGLCILPTDYTPHLQVCLPNKLFEYAMGGVPILASPLAALSDVVVRSDIGCVLTSLDPTDISEALSTMMDDPASLARMRQNALAISQSEFCWEKEQKQLVKIYKKMEVQVP